MSNPGIKPQKPKNLARLEISLQLVLVDLASLLLACFLAIKFWSLVNPTLHPAFYLQLLPLAGLFILLYAASGLYPAVGISPVEELRRLSITTTFLFLGLAAISFYVRNAEAFSRAAFGLAWVLALALIPIGRQLYRWLAARNPEWGEPVAIFGCGPQAHSLLTYLRRNPQAGLRPYLIIGDGISAPLPEGIHVIPDLAILSGTAEKEITNVRTAILIKEEISPSMLKYAVEEARLNFTHLILLSDILPIGSLWVTPFDLGGVLGLEIRQNLLSRRQQFLKRLLDIGLTLVLAPFLLPLILLIIVLIRVDSPGSVFFGHQRIGQNGKMIKVWKFRTMVQNAPEVLAETLASNLAPRQEWEQTRKLRADPRITRLGGFLRKFSLDELPQMWNVIKGEMSIVGPRPIVEEEIPHYGSYFNLYKQVKTGITGMWQISGRNDLSYAERVQLDSYYVRNWSIWLDLYILMNTLATVISGKGAY
jgi:Undecaprenyl-phosphate galactose phosphotransferase WbaP